MIEKQGESGYKCAQVRDQMRDQKEKGNRLGCPNLLIMRSEPCRARTCDPLIKSQLLYQLS